MLFVDRDCMSNDDHWNAKKKNHLLPLLNSLILKAFLTVLTHSFAEFGVFILGVHVSQFKPPVVPTDIDPFPLFMEEGVQTILNDITGIDLKKTALLQPKKLPLKPVLRAVPDKELKRVIV